MRNAGPLPPIKNARLFMTASQNQLRDKAEPNAVPAYKSEEWKV
jgi:hypothetical protein